ncbi:MarR family winged helix-turn-helix transcriptional regulator [Streptomyces zaomyceticus]|uniref:MarR family winged helix-turn-helix transcriptional regulator n=1 Tax=Streptomyces zaomyceticus TaxID=68286 RepID=UPI0036BBD288
MSEGDSVRLPRNRVRPAQEEQLDFSLYLASRAMTTHYREALGDSGLTFPKYLVMKALWEHGSIAVRDLRALLQIDSGSLSPLLKHLEAACLVRRSRDIDDERRVTISITPEGAMLRDPVTAALDRPRISPSVSPDDCLYLAARLDALTSKSTD